MPVYYISRDQSVTQAVNTFTAMTTLGADTVAAPTVPTGVSKITQILATVVLDGAIVVSTGAAFYLRLTGNGMKDGEQTLTIGAIRNAATDTGASGLFWSLVLNVNLAVTPGNDITMSLAYTGTDVGTPEIHVTLVFT